MGQPLVVIIADIMRVTITAWISAFSSASPGYSSNSAVADYRSGRKIPRYAVSLRLGSRTANHRVDAFQSHYDEMEVIICTIFGLSRAVSADFVAAIYTFTEGNPFFIEEMIANLSPLQVRSCTVTENWSADREKGKQRKECPCPTIHTFHAAHCLLCSSV